MKPSDPANMRPLSLADLDRATVVQARAFMNDPLWVYLIPDLRQRQIYLPRFSRVLFRFGILNGQAYGVGDPLGGVALWSAPAQKTRLSAALRAGFPRLLFSPFLFQFVRAGEIFGRFGEMQKQYAPDPHYYLNTISVLPEAQGQGLASKLIRPILAQADREGVSTYTETMTPSNVGLYQHYGFQVMEEYRVPGKDLSLWAFYRPVTK